MALIQKGHERIVFVLHFRHEIKRCEVSYIADTLKEAQQMITRYKKSGWSVAGKKARFERVPDATTENLFPQCKVLFEQEI